MCVTEALDHCCGAVLSGFDWALADRTVTDRARKVRHGGARLEPSGGRKVVLSDDFR
jgi:hypothetical protein